MPKTSPFPQSFEELNAAGYTRTGEGTCRACFVPILWYRTPRGANIPIDSDGKAAHFSTCPHAKRFKKEKR